MTSSNTARRVFLAPLGTSAYRPATYAPLPDEPRTAETPYIQQARLEALAGSDAGFPDKVIVFVTSGQKGSRSLNWDHRNKGKDEEEGKILPPADDGLRARLEASCPLRPLDDRTGCSALEIPTGNSEVELWEIFDKLNRAVRDDDELYIDVTHGLRSLPIVLLTALDYLQRARGIEIAQVTYGAFEAPADAHGAKPTFDLTPFFVLREWSGALALMDVGDLRALGQCLQAPVSSLGRLLRAEKPKEFGQLAKGLVQLGDDLWSNRLRELPKRIRWVRKNLEGARSELDALRDRASDDERLARVVGALYPLDSVLDRLSDTLSTLYPRPSDPDEVQGLLAAGYCFEHGLVVQGFTLLRESMIDHLARVLQVPPDSRPRVDKLWGCLVVIGQKKQPDAPENPDQRALYAALCEPPHPAVGGADSLRVFSELAQEVTQHRNALNHAGTEKNATIPDTGTLAEVGHKNVDRALALVREAS